MKKIIYFGNKGSYSEKAMNAFLNIYDFSEYIIESSGYIDEIITTVDKNDDIIGVLPIENSIEGMVRETMDKIILTDNSVKIYQEIILPISHCLINKSGKLKDVKTILSHQQALAQCSNYIKKLGAKNGCIIKKQTSISTSEAVKALETLDNSYAAISNKEAAQIYSKKIADTQINDEKDNKTRFICITKKNKEKTGNDKTSFVFATQNKPGALVDILSVLKESGINMSHIDSRPSKKVLGEYIFYVDIDGHIEDKTINSAIKKIKAAVKYYRFLGSYPSITVV